VVAGRVQVQVVAVVERGQDLPGIGGIADRLVEVDDGIEPVAGADPLVDRLAGRLAVSARVVRLGWRRRCRCR
jgi:hypothetical protein